MYKLSRDQMVRFNSLGSNHLFRVFIVFLGVAFPEQAYRYLKFYCF